MYDISVPIMNRIVKRSGRERVLERNGLGDKTLQCHSQKELLGAKNMNNLVVASS